MSHSTYLQLKLLVSRPLNILILLQKMIVFIVAWWYDFKHKILSWSKCTKIKKRGNTASAKMFTEWILKMWYFIIELKYVLYLLSILFGHVIILFRQAHCHFPCLRPEATIVIIFFLQPWLLWLLVPVSLSSFCFFFLAKKKLLFPITL